jgi:hypothetical protein
MFILTDFERHLSDLLVSIDECLTDNRLLPCLVLLYTGIDVIASLETEGKAQRDGFIRWVKKYLLKSKILECNGIDLYAARCEVVHTFTAESNLHTDLPQLSRGC